MSRHPFRYAILLGVLGLVPFLAFGAAVLFNPTASPNAILLLISYGAIILSFTGAVHWGFALREGAAALPLGAERQLLLFGVGPAIIGWVALLALIMGGKPALAVFILLAGFFSTVVAETIGKGKNIVPSDYLVLRWGLSIVVLVVLLIVLFAVLSGMRVG